MTENITAMKDLLIENNYRLWLNSDGSSTNHQRS